MTNDQTQARLILSDELHLLSSIMRRVATVLRRAFPNEPEASQHADELDGAAEKVEQWIKELKKEK